MSEIVNSWWFTCMDGSIIGIVKTDSDKFYIGKGFGLSEGHDQLYIKTHGTPFHPEQIK